MAARRGKQKNSVEIEGRRARVRTYYFEREWTYVAIAEREKTTRSTIARDVAILKKEFATATRDFNSLVEIATRAERLRTITARAMRSARTTKDDGYRARLLKVAVSAINSEVELLQTCGFGYVGPAYVAGSKKKPVKTGSKLVGMTGFEPATP